MLIRNLQDCEDFIGEDKTILRELFHPDKADISFRYSLAHATLNPGQSSMDHRLKTSEVYYILEGKGRMHVDEEAEEVQAGQAVYIPPGAIQKIENIGDHDLKFLCIVDPAWQPGDEEVL